MLRQNGSLVFFTILSQWSVGIVVCLAGLSWGNPLALQQGSGLAIALLLALILVVVATTVSFLHLGNPANAPKAARNLATSWLSREILAIGLYTASLLAALVTARTSGGGAVTPYLLSACSLAGLFLVWSMARVYRIPTVPAWNTGFTNVAFLSATLSLGLITLLLFDAAGVLTRQNGTPTFYTGLLVAVLAVEMGSGLVGYFRLARMETGIDGPSFARGGLLFRLFRARMAMAFLACLLLLYFTLHTELPPGALVSAGLLLATVLVALQEFAARVLFYASYFRVGL